MDDDKLREQDEQSYDDYRREMQGLPPKQKEELILGNKKFELFLMVDEVIDLHKYTKTTTHLHPKLVWTNKFGFTIIQTSDIQLIREYLPTVDIEELIKKEEEESTIHNE